MGTEPTMFSHYDRLEIARLCERARLYQRALEHYTDIDDIKRVMLNSQVSVLCFVLFVSPFVLCMHNIKYASCSQLDSHLSSPNLL